MCIRDSSLVVAAAALPPRHLLPRHHHLRGVVHNAALRVVRPRAVVVEWPQRVKRERGLRLLVLVVLTSVVVLFLVLAVVAAEGEGREVAPSRRTICGQDGCQALRRLLRELKELRVRVLLNKLESLARCRHLLLMLMLVRRG